MKIAVVYWSGTGNTEVMANAVLEGVNAAGGEGFLLTAAEFTADQIRGSPCCFRNSFSDAALQRSPFRCSWYK